MSVSHFEFKIHAKGKGYQTYLSSDQVYAESMPDFTTQMLPSDPIPSREEQRLS